MSLFKAKDWWSSEINDPETELLSFTNLTLGRLGEEGTGDIILFGGSNGILQLFKPHQYYQPTDLLLEYPTLEPIIQVKTGKLVFGSHNECIAVLHPKKLQVYSYISKEGQTEYGDQNNLVLEYEHTLPSDSLLMVLGNFGGVIGKDFICVLCLDGQLLFFEQEVATFSCIIPNIYLPSPFEYSHTSDSFIFCNNDLMLESYSYHNLCQYGSIENTGSKKNAPDWVYNIGDNVKFMEKVQTSNNYSSIFAISDRTLYCILDNGTLKYMKRFEYEPVCFQAYLVGWYHEPNSHLMAMVVSETSMLFIYEHTTLLWACQLISLPMAIKRGFFPGLSGGIVTLSEDGILKCSYMGTEPELFTAPALAAVDIDYEKAQEELDKLQTEIDSFNDSVEMTVANNAAEKEISFITDMKLVPISNISEECETEDNFPYLCKVAILIKPADKTNIEIVEVVLNVKSPLVCTNSSQTFLLVSDELLMASDIYWDQQSEKLLTSSYIEVIISFNNKQGYSRVLRKMEKLPPEMLFIGATPIKDAMYKITIATNTNMVDITQLFKDIDFSKCSISSTAIGLNNYKNGDDMVSIVCAKSSQRYRIQSNSINLIAVAMSEFCERLKKYLQNKGQYNKEESKNNSVISFSGPLSNEILDCVSECIEKHLLLRKKIAVAEECLDILSSQFIMIQKRLIVKYRERPPTPCEDLSFILSDTHAKILETVQEVQDSRREVLKCGNELKCCIKLIQNILQITERDKNETDLIIDAINPDSLDSEDQRWEETALSSAQHLLNTMFSKADNKLDKFSSFDPSIPIKDYNVKKCVKYIRLLIELSINKSPKMKEEDKLPIDERIEHSEDVQQKILALPEGSMYGLKIAPVKKNTEIAPNEEGVIFV